MDSFRVVGQIIPIVIHLPSFPRNGTYTSVVRNGSWTMMMLTEKEYKETFTDKMEDVTLTTESVIDIWPYVKQLVRDKVVLEYVFQNELVEKVYRNSKLTFYHVLLPTDNSNVFIVIVVNIRKDKIKGYYRLDLNKEYGLD